jgi:aldehyde dehydrogenase (NAD+)
MGDTVKNYVDDQWIESRTGETQESHNPADTGDIVGRFQRSSREDAADAVEAASDAADQWAATPGPERSRVLRAVGEELAARKDDLTEALVREEGKVRSEAAGEVQRAIDIFHYYAGKAREFGGDVRPSSSGDTSLYTVHEPVGVAALITPWNYPVAIPAWKMAPALATGNAVVFKPANPAAVVSSRFVEALAAAGVPDGVVNMVTGPGDEVGDELTRNDDVDAVSFTGSRGVGELVYEAAAPDQKRVQLEMGGKNPAVVMPSADVVEAVEIVGAGAFGVTGQACTATSRAIVHEDLLDEFVAGIVDYAEAIDVGPGLDGGEMGPQVSADELEGTLEYVETGVEEGATLETGGGRPTGDGVADGHFVEPTVFTDAEPDMTIAQHEIFGPVLAVIAVSDFTEAVTVANDVEQGLSASIVTDDLTEANRFVTEIDAGVAKVNEKTTGLELHVPFGGMKASSSETYREQGEAGLDFYTISKTVYMNY